MYLLGYPKSLIQFNSQKALLWRFTIAGNNKKYLGLDVKCPILTKFGFSRQIFKKVSETKSDGNPSSGSCADTCGRTDMAKLTDAFRDYANAERPSIPYFRTQEFVPSRTAKGRRLASRWSRAGKRETQRSAWNKSCVDALYRFLQQFSDIHLQSLTLEIMRRIST